MATKNKQDRMAWYKMDAGSFISDTMGLSNNHVAIYIKLMSIYWTSGNKLPEELILKRKLAIIGSEEEAALSEILAEFFTRDDSGEHCQQGLDKQLTDISEFSATQSARASKPRPRAENFETVEVDENGKF